MSSSTQMIKIMYIATHQVGVLTTTELPLSAQVCSRIKKLGFTQHVLEILNLPHRVHGKLAYYEDKVTAGRDLLPFLGP
jgi:hypothetical protein